MKNKSVVLSVLIVGLAIFAAAVWYQTRPAPVAQVEPVQPEIAEALIRSYSPILGPEEAPVTIVEFFDPACEACRAFHPIVKDILAEYDGAVRVVLRYTPFHGEGSEQAIRVLEAARMQGIFEPVLEALLEYQPRWASHGAPDPGRIIGIAEQAGLDAEAAKAQMMAPQTVGVLNQDRADVDAVGVRGTPTFFVNGKPLDPFGADELRALVAAEVAASGS
ncbi:MULTISPECIES: DsbA family protein [Roseobacteraceae]|jgi:protein-disulfide isomerase|uniref:DsbA family protein n=1 Tax=Roseobacteraceae TaxID=2854170 RepID=UPI0022E86C6C|nr:MULTISPECIES: thioredoxin domain-containing protein [Roseobacteraceae]MCH1387285.1 thioredoxin domain-containing protein [Paracoccaceae bacterium]WIF32464.1 Protein-disulfide isomerase [Lentibacter algarum]